MDPELERRITFFEDAGQAAADLCAFVRAELARLTAAGYVITEGSAAMFTTHLLTALQRVRQGVPLEDSPAAELIAAELASRADAIRLAQNLADRASTGSGVRLPAGEVDYVALHIASLPRQTADKAAAG